MGTSERTAQPYIRSLNFVFGSLIICRPVCDHESGRPKCANFMATKQQQWTHCQFQRHSGVTFSREEERKVRIWSKGECELITNFSATKRRSENSADHKAQISPGAECKVRPIVFGCILCQAHKNVLPERVSLLKP